ncbi:hypothetical protein MLD38_019599 [Melastoma candidum]|uniref:Uncharacterized protein n=1 Tax=Melastoma candidum TaxID=119954 RepID=A0ACB9QXE9_9MYRT|nr:hypothetical protein MLD38_019599 [Melastoma candidum]
MEGPRRHREMTPIVKKTRLAQDLNQGFAMRPGQQRYRNLDGGGAGDEEDDDDGNREAYQPQPLPPHQLHKELVEQYKSALSELTFNSKPIITNLTIIAGENLPAANAIAATVCANILEVPRDQKLPSLYLLDSIVKNIGRDYIKYFAARLPEVFCAVYQQVNPAVQNSMRHLFGTWKGVFLAQTLQVIERELCFGNPGNGSLGSVASRTDSRSQRTAPSIHVNPKYLEIQRLQQSSGNTQLVQRNRLGDSVPDTNDDGVIYDDYKMGSSLSKASGLRAGRTSGRTDPRIGRLFVPGDTDAPSTTQQNGFPTKLGVSAYPVTKPTNFDLPRQSTVTSRTGSDISNSWKNSEEEEFLWNSVDPRLRDRDTANITNARKDRGDLEDMDFEGSLKQSSKGGIPFSGDRDNLNVSECYSSRVNKFAYLSPLTRLVAGSQTKTPVSSISRAIGNEQFTSTGPLLPTHHSLENFIEEEFGQSDNRAESRASLISGKSSVLPKNKDNEDLSTDLRNHTSRSSPQLTATQRRKRPLSQQLLSASETIGLRKKPPLLQVSDHEIVSKSRSGGSLSLTEELTAGANEIGQNIPMVNHSSGALELRQPKRTKLPISSDPSPSSSHSTLKPVSSSVPNTSDDNISDAADNETERSRSASKSAPSPVSSLLSTLVAKGLISASKAETSSPVSSELPVQLLKQREDETFSGLISAASPSSSAVGEAPASKSSCDLPHSGSSKLPKRVIGLEFNPKVLREVNEDVIDELLEELPHRCDICGSRFKQEGLLDKHLRWHAMKNPDQENEISISRGWYAHSDGWVAGTTELQSESEYATSEEMNDQEPMVPADETQCACILCGEVFDDLYSVDINEWMFKEAVYLDCSLPDSKTGAVNNNPIKGPIVHVNCIREETHESLGLARNLKQENDEVMQDT